MRLLPFFLLCEGFRAREEPQHTIASAQIFLFLWRELSRFVSAHELEEGFGGTNALLLLAILPCLPCAEAHERKQQRRNDRDAVALPQRAEAVVGEGFVDLAEDFAHGTLEGRSSMVFGRDFGMVFGTLVVVRGLDNLC